MKDKNTAIIILNYNNYEDTINCIESVEQFNSSNVKIIVVDNGSTRKGVVSALDKHLSTKYEHQYKQYSDNDKPPHYLPYASLLVSDTNDGYARGNNKALKFIENDNDIKYVMILNSDVLFVEDIIPRLVQEIESDDNIGIVSPLLYKKDMKGIDYSCARNSEPARVTIGRFLLFFFNPFKIKDKWYYRQQYLKNHPELKDKHRFMIELPSGSCMLMRKELFKSIGYFDPNTFLFYEEDILYKKIRKVGKTNYIYPQLKCIHLGATTTKHKTGFFITKATVESGCYYITNYCDIPKLVKVLFRLYIYDILLPIAKAKNICANIIK